MTGESAAMTPEQFRVWITDHGYTQESLAEALGINRTSLYKWLMGRHPVTVTVKLALDHLASKRPIASDPKVPMTGAEFAQWMEDNAFDDALLAEVLDVHPLSVHRWRTGRHPISYPTRLAMERIALDQRGLAARRRIREVETQVKAEAETRAAERIQSVRRKALVASRR